jgi:hypothetical protein
MQQTKKSIKLLHKLTHNNFSRNNISNGYICWEVIHVLFSHLATIVQVHYHFSQFNSKENTDEVFLKKSILSTILM